MAIDDANGGKQPTWWELLSKIHKALEKTGKTFPDPVKETDVLEAVLDALEAQGLVISEMKDTHRPGGSHRTFRELIIARSAREWDGSEKAHIASKAAWVNYALRQTGLPLMTETELAAIG